MMDDDKQDTKDRLNEAIRGVIGEFTPFIIAYDASNLDPDAPDVIGISKNRHQRSYVGIGLLQSALAYESEWFDYEDD